MAECDHIWEPVGAGNATFTIDGEPEPVRSMDSQCSKCGKFESRVDLTWPTPKAGSAS